MRCLFVLTYFSPLSCEAHRSSDLERCVNSLRNVDFSDTHPLNSMPFLRGGCVSVLEIVFVGQCKVFVLILWRCFFSLGCGAHRSAKGVSNVDIFFFFFSDTHPLNRSGKGGCFLLE